MPYAPGQQYRGDRYLFEGIRSAGRSIAGGIDKGQERKALEKSQQQQLKGFKMMHDASPELQQLIPVKDWGDVSPNAVKGFTQALGMMAEQQRQQQAQRASTRADVGLKMKLGESVAKQEAMAALPGEKAQTYIDMQGQDINTMNALKMMDEGKSALDPRIHSLPGGRSAVSFGKSFQVLTDPKKDKKKLPPFTSAFRTAMGQADMPGEAVFMKPKDRDKLYPAPTRKVQEAAQKVMADYGFPAETWEKPVDDSASTQEKWREVLKINF